MQLVDIGANLTHPAFRDDLPEVLQRARDAGVATIIVTGTTVEETRKALALGFFTTAGVHPHHARECNAEIISLIKELANHARVVAIGECGLDFKRNYSTHPDQELWVSRQLQLGPRL